MKATVTNGQSTQQTKGIILAGGLGTRLAPVTFGVSKQLLPVYDKPMVYYPLSVLMLAGIREVLIITTKYDQDAFKRILGDGSHLGMCISYAYQDEPKGVAHALIVAQVFLNGGSGCLVLGDNLFYGQGFSAMLKAAMQQQTGATVFTYPVNDVSRFGMVSFHENGSIKAMVEKPDQAEVGFAVTGLYFFDHQAVDFALQLKPSARQELEMITLLHQYLDQEQLKVQQLGRGFAWSDMGTSDALLGASHFVQTLEKNQGFKIACLEEIAWRNGWMNKHMLEQQAKRLSGSSYALYLQQLLCTISD